MLEATSGKTAAAGQGAPRCGECRFHDQEKMWCRRRAPGAVGGYWPHASLSDWCGEFEPKPAATESAPEEGPKADASPESAALEGDHALRRCGTCWAKPTIQSTQHAGESEVFYSAEAKCERPALCGSFCSAPSAASEEEAVALWNQTYGDTGDQRGAAGATADRAAAEEGPKADASPENAALEGDHALRRCGKCWAEPKLAHEDPTPPPPAAGTPLWTVEARCEDGGGYCSLASGSAEKAVAQWNQTYGDTGDHPDA